MESLKFYFDTLCPWCYQTSRWARRLEQLGEIELDWGVFSLGIVNAPEGQDPHAVESQSAPALRTAMVIRDTYGSRRIGQFYAALGELVWETVPPAPQDEATVKRALVAAGFDPGLCDQALQDPATWDAVIAEHQSLVDTFQGFGVPTLVLDGGTGPAIFGPAISDLPDDQKSVELWHHLLWLVRYDNFWELKRARPRPPRLPALEWRALQGQEVTLARQG